jgi:putative ABC transport system substrate-binding protein
LKVDVIVTVRSAVPTVRQVTSTIPIIFAVAIDLVGSGLVESLAKPGAGTLLACRFKRLTSPESE